MHSVYEGKKGEFWHNEIAANANDTRRLWRRMQGLLGETSTSETGAHAANDFAAFFKDKVDTVRASTAATPVYEVPSRATTSTLEEWSTVTVNEVEKLISSALNKTSQLDPAPTWLVKEMRGHLAPFITLMFNRSLVTGCFPAEFKQAVVRPLLKKSGLDTSKMKSYRPVSNLSFLSKLLEKVVQDRIQTFLDSNGLIAMYTICLPEIPQH